MAIDTAAKRLAALNMGPIGIVLPAPDGTLALADRWHLLRLYYMIPAVPTEPWVAHRARDLTRSEAPRDLRLDAGYDTTRQQAARSLHWPGAD